ncbi:MAG: hypothetical protein R3230_02535 [Nitrosopumilaceae archaeon]|nr:hypothetical protein [Nitrosopumilaceae archaeon]
MSESAESHISICDLFKENTSKLIQKMESQVPLYGQIYSDIYKENFEMLEDIFGTCYISEKEFFDKLNINQYTLKQWDMYWKNAVDFYSKQIDASTNLLKIYAQSRISGMNLYKNYMHLMMDSYQKMLSNFNSFNGK